MTGDHKLRLRVVVLFYEKTCAEVNDVGGRLTIDTRLCAQRLVLFRHPNRFCSFVAFFPDYYCPVLQNVSLELMLTPAKI